MQDIFSATSLVCFMSAQNPKLVFVYRNLHKKCFSVRCQKTKLVIAHVKEIVLDNCRFKVSEAGRKRVLKSQVKNVHAGVVGEWNRKAIAAPLRKRITYNPYLYSSFVTEKGKKPISKAKRCVIRMDGVTVR